ncbi:MAG: MFS transporter [Erythrobacter sp.]
MALQKIGSGALPAFTDGTRLRLFLGTMLYLAQGFPQGVLFYALPTWLAVNGASAAELGMIASAALLPWSFKFLMGGFVDRYAYLAMGRRRGWLVGAQFVIVAVFLIFAAVQPTPDATALIAGLAFALSSATATQDIALDALVIDLTPEKELGRLNGFMFGGKLLGIAGGTAFTAFLIEHYSIRTAMIGSLVFFMIPAITALLIRERPGEKLLPWTSGVASAEAIATSPDKWLPLLKTALKSMMRRDVLIVLALLSLYGVHQQIMDNSSALFAANVMGWGETRFTSLIAMVNIGSAVLCLTVGGWMVDKFGPKLMALISGFSAAAIIGVLAVNRELWGQETFFVIWYVSASVAILQFYLAMLVLAMRVTDQAAAAINFNILMGCFALGSTLGGASLGVIDAIGGLGALFGAAAILLALSAACAIFLSKALGPSNSIGGEPDDNEIPVAALP